LRDTRQRLMRGPASAAKLASFRLGAGRMATEQDEGVQDDLSPSRKPFIYFQF